MTLEALAATQVSMIPLRQPVTVTEDAPLIRVVEQMRELRRGAAMIEDGEGMVIGIVTERDFMLRVAHHDSSWHTMTVGEVMTRDLIWVKPTDSLSVALRAMQKGYFRHIPVLDDRGKAVGLLSIRDILSYTVEFFPGAFINLPPGPDHEASQLWGG